MARGRYNVIWMPAAEGDLAAIQDFIGQDRPAVAQGIVESLRVKASTLTTYPLRGRCVPELQGRTGHSYRELICPPWRLIYRVHARVVIVLGVIDSRRKIEDVLRERLARSEGVPP